MENYSLLFVRSNQWSIQGRYVMSTTIVLRKSLCLHIYCLGRRVLTELDRDFNENSMDCDALSRRVYYLQTLVVHYWNRWRREYLSELRERRKLKMFSRSANQIKRSRYYRRNSCTKIRWKIGQMEEFVWSKDGFSRGCKLPVIGKRGHYSLKDL